ncbi:MAG: hypothetical protein NTY22_07805, partial [Proteobacteria bacterium]|nr:hypothetical protein [Pseudomonadota bacterium]
MATLDVLNRKIKQMHTALGGITSNSTEELRPIISSEGKRRSIEYDFTGIYDEAELHNKLESLINNIASVKDHLREWCNQNGIEFKGEELIDREKD